MQSNSNSFSFIADFDGNDLRIFDIPFDDVLPVLPLRDTVLFPGVILPVAIGRPLSIHLVREADVTGAIFATATQREPQVEWPSGKDLYDRGVAARVLRIFDLPDGNCTALLQGLSSVELSRFKVDATGIRAHVKRCEEMIPEMDDPVFTVVNSHLRDRMIEYMELSDRYGDEDIAGLNNYYGMPFFLNHVCTNAPLPVDEKLNLLIEPSPLARATQLLRLLAREIQLANLSSEIRQQTQADIDKQQREFFLQQQLRNIQEQLGNSKQDDAIRFREKAQGMNIPQEAYDTFIHEVEKLERLNPQSPDYQVLYNYLEVMLQLPWGVLTKDNLNLKNAERVLNKNHYGMKEVKERILEHLAVGGIHGAVRLRLLAAHAFVDLAMRRRTDIETFALVTPTALQSKGARRHGLRLYRSSGPGWRHFLRCRATHIVLRAHDVHDGHAVAPQAELYLSAVGTAIHLDIQKFGLLGIRRPQRQRLSRDTAAIEHKGTAIALNGERSPRPDILHGLRLLVAHEIRRDALRREDDGALPREQAHAQCRLPGGKGGGSREHTA